MLTRTDRSTHLRIMEQQNPIVVRTGLVAEAGLTATLGIRTKLQYIRIGNRIHVTNDQGPNAYRVQTPVVYYLPTHALCCRHLITNITSRKSLQFQSAFSGILYPSDKLSVGKRCVDNTHVQQPFRLVAETYNSCTFGQGADELDPPNHQKTVCGMRQTTRRCRVAFGRIVIPLLCNEALSAF